MKMQDVRAVAKGLGIKISRRKKEDLVRDIQRAEGNRDCYNRGLSTTCGQDGCAWRDDCK
jgi:hypothetical protein